MKNKNKFKEFIGRPINEIENSLKDSSEIRALFQFIRKNEISKEAIFDEDLYTMFTQFDITKKRNPRNINVYSVYGSTSFRPITNKKLNILIDKGNATTEDIAELISKISKLYRLFGGSGINFTKENISILTLNDVNNV